MVPILLVALVTVGTLAGNLISIPSFSQTYGNIETVDEERRQTVTIEVSGVRCVDTARRAANQLEGVAGVLGLTAYASDHELVIEYDTAVVDVDRLVQALEGPVYDAQQNKFFFHVFTVVAIDGRNLR